MEKRKPINPPKMWQVRNVFVDETGEVFSKAKHVEMLKGIITSENINDKDAILSAINILDGGIKISFEKHLKTISKKASSPIQKPKEEKTSDDIFYLSLKKIEELSKKIENLEKRKEASSNRIDANEFAEAFVRAQKESDGVSFLKNERDIDKEDFIDVGVTFASYGILFVLSGDLRGGHYINSPYKIPFTFKYVATNRSKGNMKEEKISHFCSFTTHSKKEIEWLKNHTRFNVEFWLSRENALDADAEIVHAASGLMTGLLKQNQKSIIDRCRGEGILITSDINIMRANLANKLAIKVVEASHSKAANMARGAREEEMFKK